MGLSCLPQTEARVYNESYKMFAEAWSNLGSLQLPITVACGTDDPEAMFNESEAGAPVLVAALDTGRLEK